MTDIRTLEERVERSELVRRSEEVGREVERMRGAGLFDNDGDRRSLASHMAFSRWCEMHTEERVDGD